MESFVRFFIDFLGNSTFVFVWVVFVFLLRRFRGYLFDMCDLLVNFIEIVLKGEVGFFVN